MANVLAMPPVARMPQLRVRGVESLGGMFASQLLCYLESVGREKKESGRGKIPDGFFRAGNRSGMPCDVN